MNDAPPKNGRLIALAGLLVGGGLVCLLLIGLGGWFLTRLDIASPAKTATYAPTRPASGVITATQAISDTSNAPGMASSANNQSNSLSDIPLPNGVRAEQALGDDRSFSIITQLPQDRVTQFYLLAMPQWGWLVIDTGTRITPQTSELTYQKNGRLCKITITRTPFVGTVISVQFEAT